MNEESQKNENVLPPIVDIEKLNQDLPNEYIAEKVQNEESGVGSVYTVPKNSYAAFKAAVLNNGYDIDNYFGWQCWDGAALLWQQFGHGLLTGNGLAIGCWDLRRKENQYGKFDLVGSVNQLKKGDVVVMRPNHIGFFDGFDGAYMRILGQNQGGKPGPNGGSSFNVVRITKAAFAGAFRLKSWHVAAPKPQPTPAPKPKPTVGKYRIKAGDTLVTIAQKYGMSWKQLWNFDFNRALIGSNPNMLKIGQVINVPQKPTPAPKHTYYRVRKGDYLSLIAARNKVSIEKLVNWNKAKYPSLSKNPGLINPGWILRVK